MTASGPLPNVGAIVLTADLSALDAGRSVFRASLVRDDLEGALQPPLARPFERARASDSSKLTFAPPTHASVVAINHTAPNLKVR